MLGWSFASFRREIAEPATFDPKTTPWLHGMWKSVATVVRPIQRVQPVPQKAFYESHSPFDLLEQPRISQYTMAMAEISPPLFTGVRMASMSIAGLRFRGSGALRVDLEPARLGRAFSTNAGNPSRLRALFERRSPTDDFPELLAAAAERTSITIQDGVVEVFLPGKIFDAKVVGGEFDAAVAIAHQLSLRSAELAEDPNVAATKREWRDVASARGLQFDPVRWHAYGHIDGGRIEVLLEPSETFVRTTVRAALRTPLGATPPDSVVADVRRELVKAKSVAAYVLVHDTEVLLAQERCSAARELGALIDQAVAIVDAANPKAAPAEPYR